MAEYPRAMRPLKSLAVFILLFPWYGVSFNAVAKASRKARLVNALTELYAPEDGDVRFYLKWFDLNGDGIQEAIVHVVGPTVCGTGGCHTLIFKKRANRYVLVSNIAVSRPLIIALPGRKHGWRNLRVFVVGGGELIGYYSKLEFDGVTYPENASTRPALRLVHRPHGKVLIRRFRIYTTATPVYPKTAI